MNITHPSDKNLADWAKWVSERPDNVRQVIEKHNFRPWVLYRMKSTNHRVTVAGFDEQEDDSVTIRVDVTKEFNFVAFERQVFGVKPDNLEECDLPAEGEVLGSLNLGVRDARMMLCNSIRAGLLETDPSWPLDTSTIARAWFTKIADTMSPVTRAKVEGALDHWAWIEKAIEHDALAAKEPSDE